MINNMNKVKIKEWESYLKNLQRAYEINEQEIKYTKCVIEFLELKIYHNEFLNENLKLEIAEAKKEIKKLNSE